jgi:hypothetical protein
VALRRIIVGYRARKLPYVVVLGRSATIGSFVPSEIVFGLIMEANNLTPNPFPSGKGNRMRENPSLGEVRGMERVASIALVVARETKPGQAEKFIPKDAPMNEWGCSGSFRAECWDDSA